MSVKTYVEAFERAKQEPKWMHGMVFQQSGSDVRVLAKNGETPVGIPASAVEDDRVVIYVDGIHQEWTEQQRQIRTFIEPRVEQPVIGIHEAAGKSTIGDGARIGKVLSYLKLVQSGAIPLSWAAKRLYKIDPSVKSVHDEVKTAVESGLKVQLVTHSGGGAETAAALNVLGREGVDLSDVRVLSCASAAAFEDFTSAGVKPENIYYTGSVNDPVYAMMRHFLPCGMPGLIGDLVTYVMNQKDPLSYHSPDYIFGNNPQMGAYLAGGPGGKYPLP